MNIAVIHVGLGKNLFKKCRLAHPCLSESLVASAPTESTSRDYLDSLNSWEAPPDVALNKAEKLHVVNII